MTIRCVTFPDMSDSATITVVKVDIAPAETNLCWTTQSATLNLTSDSFPGGPVEWTVAPSTGLSINSSDNTSFTFSPTNSTSGTYTVTAKSLMVASHLDTCTVNIVQSEVTNIKFNHDSGASVQDALNIRQDYNTAYDLSNGEWVKGGTNLPACYTTHTVVTIKARLTVQPASITSADIWAVSTDSDGSLGDVIKTNVIFSGGVSSPEYVTFQVSGPTPNAIKKTTSDVWQWKMENVKGTGSAAWDLNISGAHKVYTILNEPVAPWINATGSQKNAWTKALDFVIANASCNGDSTASNALLHIAQYLHTGHGLTYDINGGRSKYASSQLGGTMSLTGYIDKSATIYGTAGNVINCYDQASGVYSFGRMLGISVAYRYMSPFGYINIVNLVGEGNCNNPFYPYTTGGKIAGDDDADPVRSGFGNHAFTVFGGYVYDACAGPQTGTRTETQYVSDTVDASTPAEAFVAGDTSNISSGAVTDLQ